MPVLRTLLRPLLAVAAAGLVLLSAAPAGAAAPPGPTPQQERVVLGLIDDICGDTWCEGDYAFDFRSFTCHGARSTCTLRLRIAPYDDGRRHWRWRSGQVHGFVTFRSMVRTSHGSRSLQPDFYDAVDELVNALEDTVRPADRVAAEGAGRLGG